MAGDKRVMGGLVFGVSRSLWFVRGGGLDVSGMVCAGRGAWR